MSRSGWGIPVDIPVPPGGTGGVPDWTALKFNPLGVYNLRRRLGALSREPGVFMRYKDRFLNSDISWFASGLHNDGQHTTSRDTFHPLFLTAREHTGVGEPANKLRNKLRDSVRDHVFDMATLWDRAYGGFSMVLHVDGTTIPNTPALPEYLKAHVYLPPNLMNEFSECQEAIAQIVQSFIETIGVPTVMRWRRAASNNNWSLTQSGGVPVPSTHNLPLVPNPTMPTSSYYIFPGRPYGSLPLDGASSHLSHLPSLPDVGPSSPSRPTQHDVLDTGLSASSDAQDANHGPEWDAIMERNTRLNKELNEARDREAEQEQVIASLREEIRNFVVRQDKRGYNELPARPTASGSNNMLPNLQTGTNTRIFLPGSQPQTFAPSSSATASHRASSSSPVRESFTLQPNYQPSSPSTTRIWGHPLTAQVRFATPSTNHAMRRPVLRGGLQSFGFYSEAFIENNSLDDRFHSELYRLYECTLPAKWHQEIVSWFAGYEEATASSLAGGLHEAMCADAAAHQ